jgi:riboflavin kinase/FMN adenylyltransferase
MDIIKGHQALTGALARPTMAIGNFDGVHRGHQAVLQAAQAAARQARSAAGVMVFEPHPRQYFKPDQPLFRLTPLELKLKLFEMFGLDFAVVLDFDAALAAMSADAFIREVLIGEFDARHVVTGYDFHFGKDRQGTPDFLKKTGDEIGLDVTIVDAVGEDDVTFSSSDARALLQRGDVEAAANILGYWWRVLGDVQTGAARGSDLGYPTANLKPPANFDLAHGIYAVRVIAPDGRYDGVAYVGTQPTFDGKETIIEAYLFDFAGDLYGREIEIEFIARLRGDERFETPEALTAQMERDCEEARAVLAKYSRDDPQNRFPLGRGLSLPPAGGQAAD